MPLSPLVVKLGGDALASPERIATEARRLARLARAEPTLAVTSARRGVTDHLLGLVEGVRRAVGDSSGAHAEADRAVAAGEIVTASLLALALNDLGVRAVSLDAREAGIRATGAFGAARIQAIAAGRLSRLLARGILPVVTGFQGWRRSRVATLGRGGTDTSAVALAVGLGASRALFVKDADGLRTADPRLVPDSRPIREAPHAFLTALAGAGARVVHRDAARLAEQHGLPLELFALGGSSPATVVRADVNGKELRAVATQQLDQDTAEVTVVAGSPDWSGVSAESLREALAATGVEIRGGQSTDHGSTFLVDSHQAIAATRIAHEVFVHGRNNRAAPARRAS